MWERTSGYGLSNSIYFINIVETLTRGTSFHFLFFSTQTITVKDVWLVVFFMATMREFREDEIFSRRIVKKKKKKGFPTTTTTTTKGVSNGPAWGWDEEGGKTTTTPSSIWNVCGRYVFLLNVFIKRKKGTTWKSPIKFHKKKGKTFSILLIL